MNAERAEQPMAPTENETTNLFERMRLLEIKSAEDMQKILSAIQQVAADVARVVGGKMEHCIEHKAEQAALELRVTAAEKAFSDYKAEQVKAEEARAKEVRDRTRIIWTAFIMGGASLAWKLLPLLAAEALKQVAK